MKYNEIMPLISIVVPVYNSFNLMENCLNSLDRQSNRDFEVIFVDDCSKDDSYNKLNDKLKKVHFNYKLVKNSKNSGPGVTRNNGIELSNGEYITFIDSDDFVTDDFIDVLSKTISNNNPDAIVFDYNMKKGDSFKLRHGLPFEEGFIPVLDVVALSNGMCWGKVYKKSLIVKNKILFPNLIRSEDLAFCKVFLSKCNSVFYKKQSLYVYTLNDSSIMHSSNTLNINNNINAFNYIEENTVNNAAIEMIFIREYLYLIVQIMTIKKYSTKEIKHFIDTSVKKYKGWSNNSYLKYQPFYVKIILKLIKMKIIFPIRMVFKLKK